MIMMCKKEFKGEVKGLKVSLMVWRVDWFKREENRGTANLLRD